MLMEKLKALKCKLKDVFGRVEVKKIHALQNQDHWDALGIQRPLSQIELERKATEIEEFKKWALLEEIMWRQKSREVWLQEVDKNTRFFHKMENCHRRHNDIKSIKINKEWAGEGQGLQLGIVNAFQNLLIDLGDWKANLRGLDFAKFEESEAARLEILFMQEEVWSTPKDMNGEKAPRPNGYIAAFWQSS